MDFQRVEPVAITGIGIVSPIGSGVEPFWDALLSKRRGTELGPFDAGEYTAHPQVRRMTRGIQFGLVAGEMAIRDSGLDASSERFRDRTRIVFGTTHPVTSFVEEFHQTLLEGGPAAATPMCFAVGVHNAVPFFLSDEFHIRNGSVTLVGGGSTGLEAVIQGCRLIQNGSAECALVGASTEVTPVMKVIYSAMGLLASSQVRPAPYHQASRGYLLGEGGAFLVLERKESAVVRGARIYGCIDGWTSRVFDPENTSLNLWELHEEVDVFLGAANSSDLDLLEARWVLDHQGRGPAVTNVRGHLGEGFAFTSLAQAAVAVMILTHQQVPPIVGLDTPEVSGVDFVRESRRQTVRSVRVHGMGIRDNSTVISLQKRE